MYQQDLILQYVGLLDIIKFHGVLKYLQAINFPPFFYKPKYTKRENLSQYGAFTIFELLCNAFIGAERE